MGQFLLFSLFLFTSVISLSEERYTYAAPELEVMFVFASKDMDTHKRFTHFSRLHNSISYKKKPKPSSGVSSYVIPKLIWAFENDYMHSIKTFYIRRHERGKPFFYWPIASDQVMSCNTCDKMGSRFELTLIEGNGPVADCRSNLYVESKTVSYDQTDYVGNFLKSSPRHCLKQGGAVFFKAKSFYPGLKRQELQENHWVLPKGQEEPELFVLVRAKSKSRLEEQFRVFRGLAGQKNRVGREGR